MTDSLQTGIDCAFAGAAGPVALPMTWLVAGMRILADSLTCLSPQHRTGSKHGSHR